MKSMSHNTLAAALGAGVLVFATVYAADTSKVDWKTIIPEGEITKLVDASAKNLQENTKTGGNFNQKAKSTRNEAFVVALYAQAGVNSGNEELAKKSVVLQAAALKLADAAKKKKYDDAKKEVAVIAGFKTLKGDDAKAADIDWKKELPVESLMEQVNSTNSVLAKTKRLNAAQLSGGNKAEELSLTARKMAALSVAVAAHNPGGKDEKVWTDASEGLQAASLEMANAAKAKKATEWVEALRRLDNACSKCHEVFRKEE